MIPEELALRLAMTRSDLEAQAVAEDREHEETGRVSADVDPPHNATAQRRSTGWVRWFAACPCGWSLDQVGGREGAQRQADEHNELNPDPPTEPVCGCFVDVDGRLEYSPPDCPLHKETR